MKFEEMNVGLKLELVLMDSKGDEKKFVSEFEWAEGKDIVYVAAPISEGMLYPVRVGEELQISFIYKNNLYEFYGKIAERSIKHNLNVLKLITRGEINKVQRREFFRFEYTLPIKYRVLNKESSKDCQTPFQNSYTRDLSGGGVCIRLSHEVENGCIVECETELSPQDIVTFKGKVVRVTKYDNDKNGYKFEIGVLFDTIDEKMREKIISFIFQEQRRIMKKG